MWKVCAQSALRSYTYPAQQSFKVQLSCFIKIHFSLHTIWKQYLREPHCSVFGTYFHKPWPGFSWLLVKIKSFLKVFFSLFLKCDDCNYFSFPLFWLKCDIYAHKSPDNTIYNATTRLLSCYVMIISILKKRRRTRRRLQWPIILYFNLSFFCLREENIHKFAICCAF